MKRLIVPEIFKGCNVTAFFTGKEPGSDTDEIGRMFKVGKADIYMPVQKHTDKVYVLEADRSPVIADAVITREKGVMLGVKTADCIPVLICDRKNNVVGAVHAGWRGTAENILSKTIGLAVERFACDAADFLVAIGPGIKWCCYGVDYDVMQAVKRAAGSDAGETEYVLEKGGKYCLDLASANRLQAISAGVSSGNIWVSGDCTFCNPDRYYSYRFSKGVTGRQGAFIGRLKD